jgi:hypothetical protein
VLTPFLGELGSVSIARAVVSAAGVPGRALVFADAALARALGHERWDVLLCTRSRRAQARSEYRVVRGTADVPPVPAGAFDVVVYSGHGERLRGAAEGAIKAAAEVLSWLGPLTPGGRLVLVDRIDGGILGARADASREDLCTALLAARLTGIGQLAPRAGTVVTVGTAPLRRTLA